MRSHGKTKRSRTNKDPDGDLYLNVQVDDIHSSSYSRSRSSFGSSESYRIPSTSTRGPYVSDRDVASRSRHSGDWRHAEMDHDRYPFDNGFARGERSEYDESGPRSSAGWGTVDPLPYPQPRSNWHQRYDNGTSSSSYPETSTWGIATPNSYENSRPSYHESWVPTDSRDLPLEEWSPGSTREERHSDRRQQDWRPEVRRDKNSGNKFQSDSGWNSRHRERQEWSGDLGQDDIHKEKGHHAAEDRAWEPAASWKSTSSTEYQHQRGQNAQRAPQSKFKRGHNQNKQRREWRSDDSDLNNWTRRDAGPSTTKSLANQYSTRRKHPRSPSHSRSRSRSPANSYRSHLSSRGRSRSRSFSPASKRRRRDSSPVIIRSRTPSEVNVNRPQNRKGRYSSRSPSPIRKPISVSGRRRSPSVTSTNSDRSLSKSPIPPMRSVHRLPSQNHATGNLPNNFVKGPGNGASSRKPDESRNGKSRSNRQHRKGKDPQFMSDPDYSKDPYSAPSIARRLIPNPNIRPSNYHEHPSVYDRPALQDTPPISERLPIGGPVTPPRGPVTPPPLPTTNPEQNARAVTISMPPPSIPPTHVPRSAHSRPVPLFESKVDTLAAISRNLAIKNLAFKPLAKAHSSLKKFFPGDEEDIDVISDESSVPNAPGQRSIPDNTFPVSHDSGELSSGWNDLPLPVKDVRSHQSQETPLEPPFDHGPRSRTPLNLSGYISGLEQHYPGTTPPIPLYPRISEVHGHPSPHLTESTDRPRSRRSSQEMDTNVTPSDNHEVSSNALSASTSIKDLYKIVSQVGEGTFGKVYKARNTVTGTYVALKRIRMEAERDGFPVTAMREIKLLQSLRHENVVRLYEMMVSNGSVYMVFEYMDHDLTGVLSQNQFTFSDAHLKSLCHQMLAGLAYLHHKGVIHRDIKGSNILINNRGELKLADFGLARFYQKRRRTDYTNRVITLWYRPPELLFGATVYGPEVDMWSAGCIMLELFTKKPVFQGVDEIHQVEVVFKLLGTPTTDRWADVINLPWFELVKPQQELPNHFRDAFQKWMSPAALDLAENLLAYNPTQRITALQAMDAPYFSQEAPPPSAPVGLIDLEGEWHELETKRERAKRKERKNTT